MTGGRVVVEGCGSDSLQGDVRFAEVGTTSAGVLFFVFAVCLLFNLEPALMQRDGVGPLWCSHPISLSCLSAAGQLSSRAYVCVLCSVCLPPHLLRAWLCRPAGDGADGSHGGVGALLHHHHGCETLPLPLPVPLSLPLPLPLPLPLFCCQLVLSGSAEGQQLPPWRSGKATLL